MILRKPYAFFIRYFNLIHILMLVFLVFNIYNLSSMYSFLNEYLLVTQVSLVRDFISNYNIFLVFLNQIILVVLSSIIMSVMIFKKKPALFYFISIIVFIFTIFLLIFSSDNINILLIRTIDVRIIRAIRDLILGSIIMQALLSAFVFARATGFDVKKFNFGKDLKEIETTEEDREEFEVDITIDKHSFQRKVKNNLRNLVVAYKENKYLINIVFLAFIIIMSFNFIFNYFEKNKNIRENISINLGEISFKVLSSYDTKKDYKNQVIDDDYRYIIVRVNIQNNTQRRLKINRDDFNLTSGNTNFKIASDGSNFVDIGILYKSQDLNPGNNIFLLIYKIPEKLSSNYNLNYFQSNGTNVRVKLEPNNLDGDEIVKEYQLGEKIDFSGSVLNESSFSISRYIISETLVLDYKFCYATNKCYDSFEIIKPSLYSSRKNDVLALSSELKINPNVSIPVNNTEDFLNLYGNFSYEINEVFKQEYSFKSIIPNNAEETDFNFFEVLNGSKGALKISIEFKVRNYKYIYYLFDMDYLSRPIDENI